MIPLNILLTMLLSWLEREQRDVIRFLREENRVWRAFLRAHWPALVAVDFFTTEVWTVRGLVTYYTVFTIELQSRRGHVVGPTRHPDEAFVVQAMRHLTDGFDGVLGRGRVLICDRDRKWSRAVKFLEQEHTAGSFRRRSARELQRVRRAVRSVDPTRMARRGEEYSMEQHVLEALRNPSSVGERVSCTRQALEIAWAGHAGHESSSGRAFSARHEAAPSLTCVLMWRRPPRATSRQSGPRIHRSAGAIARVRARAIEKPSVEEPVDFRLTGVAMTTSQILANDVDAHLEQVERRPESVSDRGVCPSGISWLLWFQLAGTRDASSRRVDSTRLPDAP